MEPESITRDIETLKRYEDDEVAAVTAGGLDATWRPLEKAPSMTLTNNKQQITQEQFILASPSLHLQQAGCGAAYPAGLYGWRKRCIYFFLLLLLATMIVNLALTVWIMKVMNFSLDGMGNLRLSWDGLHLEGISEFLLPLYVNEIQSRRDNLLVLRSEKNVTVNVRNEHGQVTSLLAVGPDVVEAQCRRLEVRSRGRVLFAADEEEVVMTSEKFTITGSEGAVFGGSVETPLIHVQAPEDLRLESPTRTVTMEAPRGVEVGGEKGALRVSGRKDLQLESTEGEILLDASAVRLGSIPLGGSESSPARASPEEELFEVCVCPSGKVYLSPAESSSTCQAVSNVCLWS